MAKFYSADYILPATSEPLKNGVISVDDEGLILNLYTEDSPEIQNLPINKLQGIITPGFINSHCHLELSHLRNKVPEKEGLISFIKNVINIKKTTPISQ